MKSPMDSPLQSQPNAPLSSPPNSQPRPHLNDDQMSEYLVEGLTDPASAAHLAQCGYCRQELAAFGASLGDFNDASLAWSESQPAGKLQARLHRQARTEGPRRAVAVAGWALAASLAVAAGISIANHERARELTGEPVSAVAEDTQAQIERDNRLLFAVARATSVSTASPVEEYGLEAPAQGSTQGSTQGSAQGSATDSLNGKDRRSRDLHD